MTDLIPENVKAALATLTASGVEEPPKQEAGQEEGKRDRKAREQRNAEHQAMTVLITHGLDLANRITAALETQAKPSIALAGEGMVMGELAKFEPLISPELAARGIAALEKLAGIAPPAG
jgi:hypothetical protein